MKNMRVISSFDPWKSSLCTCPPKYSLSPYTGCSHRCVYCYASSYIPNFYSPRPKKDFLKKLTQDLAKIPANSFISIANSSDPYIHLEKELKLTREMLIILNQYPIKINIVTKSDMILRDREFICNMKHILLSFSITTLNENLAKKLEPSAPSPKRRIKAIEIFSQDVPVVCRIDPLIYPLNTRVKDLRRLIRILASSGVKQIISSTYKVRHDNLKRMMKTFPDNTSLWHKLYIEEGEKINGYIYLSQRLRKELLDVVKDLCKENKLLFSICRENLQGYNTTICDGSSLLNTPEK